MYDPWGRARSTFGWILTPMVKALLIATAGAYAVELFAIYWLDAERVIAWFWLVPADVFDRGWVWQVGTYMWLHDPFSPWHLLLNLLGLFMFGGPMERRWGSRTFLRFYLTTGVIAGVVVLVVGMISYPTVPTIGCSGAVLAVAAAFGIVYAQAPVYLFGVLPMRARTLLWFIVILVLFDWFGRSEGISVAGHVGGLASGALLVTGWWRPSRIRAALRRGGSSRPRVKFDRSDGGGPRWVN